MKILKKSKLATVAGAALSAGVAFTAWQMSTIDPLTIAPPATEVALSTAEVASTVNVPVAVNLAALENQINSKIPDTLHTINDSRGGCFRKRVLGVRVSIGCTVNGRVWKAGAFQLSANGDQLIAKMPIRFEATVRGRGDIGRNIRETGRGCAEVTAIIKPTINPNWTASADVSTNFNWCERPYIRVLGIRITIGSHVEPKVKEVLAGVQPLIKQALAEANFRQEVEKAWVDMHKPIALNDAPLVTASFKPSSVHFGGFNFANDILSSQLAVTGSVKTTVGVLDNAMNPTSLPDIAPIGDVPAGFNLNVPVAITYDEIKKALAEANLAKLLADEAGLNGDELTMSDFDTYATDDALVIGATIKVSTGNPFLDHRGRVYLTAKPVVDMNKRVVSFDNLSFTAATDNAVVQAGTLLIGSRPVMKLAEKLVEIPFGDAYEGMLDAANTELNRDLADDVRMSGQLKDARLSSIQFGSEALQLTIRASGNLGVTYGLPAGS